MKKKGFVYLICDNKNEVFKIGLTKKPIEKRIKELQTGNSTELFVTSFHETDYPYLIESILHRMYRKNNVLNEWFELDDKDVINFNKTCNELEERIEVMKDNPFFKKEMR